MCHRWSRQLTSTEGPSLRGAAHSVGRAYCVGSHSESGNIGNIGSETGQTCHQPDGRHRRAAPRIRTHNPSLARFDVVFMLCAATTHPCSCQHSSNPTYGGDRAWRGGRPISEPLEAGKTKAAKCRVLCAPGAGVHLRSAQCAAIFRWGRRACCKGVQDASIESHPLPWPVLRCGIATFSRRDAAARGRTF